MEHVTRKHTREIVQTIELTEDMARTLYFYFDSYAREGITQVEVADDGSLWLPHPSGLGRQFLGSTRLLGGFDA